MMQTSENFAGKEVSYTHLLTHSIRTVRASDIFGEEDQAIYLGITRGGHAYVVAEGARIDGDLLFRLGNRNTYSDLLEAGIVIRIPVPQVTRALIELSEKPSRVVGISCMSAAYKCINRAYGIHFKNDVLASILPDATFKRILNGALRDAAGSPQDYQIYLLDTPSLAYFYSETQRHAWPPTAIMCLIANMMSYAVINSCLNH
jgi:hypothetical protein